MRFLRTAAFLLVAFTAVACAAAVPVITKYRSPKNGERAVRKETKLIVLHTTEAPAKGSLRRLSERGECHYCVTEDGAVYQIVDRNRVAFHAGCSMWDGRTEVDHRSVGIECVGYHDKAMPLEQLKSIRALVAELQKAYGIPDECVVTHSQVAYGEPNKWQKKRHRGRKRCGMLFAMPSVRRVLGLAKRQKSDPDVKAKRLVVGDDYLNKVLYGKTDTMKRVYDGVKVEADPSKKKPAAVAANAKKKEPATAPKKGAPSARPKPAFTPVPQTIAQLREQGYESVGSVTKTRMPYSIVGEDWNSPDTFYTIRSRVIPGNILNQSRIEDGMNVWRKK